uniref:Putative secreted protein n=1 Tax=Ixodes ricinus TaxID=34613 RepID=A0A6B0U968_IXORI
MRTRARSLLCLCHLLPRAARDTGLVHWRILRCLPDKRKHIEGLHTSGHRARPIPPRTQGLRVSSSKRHH